MSQRFDELSKAISKARSRREMLKMIGGAVAGALAATIMPSGGTPTASADTSFPVNSSCPPGSSPCFTLNGTTCCPPGYFCVPSPYEGFAKLCLPAVEAVQVCHQVCSGYSVNSTFIGGSNACMSQCLGVTYPFIG